MKDEALKLALDALEYLATQIKPDYEHNEAITAIKQALAAQQEHEPENEPHVSLASVREDWGPGPHEVHSLPSQPSPVKVWEAEGYDALMQEMQMVKARNIRQHAEIERLKAAQPAVPDAIGPNEDELPAYAAGWNDCRQTMLEMLKGRTA
jgi:hypothetical protein